MTAVICPDCNKTMKNQGGLNLHQRFHCSKKKEENKKEHKCKFTLLNPANEVAARALSKGYKKYCKECGELG